MSNSYKQHQVRYFSSFFSQLSKPCEFLVPIRDSQNVFYMASAQIKDSKSSKGYRATIYKCAQDCKAYYGLDGRNKSIYYEDGSNDLTIRLLFATIESGRDFQNSLSNFCFQHPSFSRKLSFEEILVPVTFEGVSNPVFYQHYRNEDSDSPPFLSLNDILSSHSESVLSNNGDPERALQSLEDLTKMPHVKCYKCHLISSQVKEHSHNPDNCIYGSWLFHQYFDALNTEDKYPELAVKFD